MGGAEDTGLAIAVDEGVAEEGVVAASRVFNKLELTMTHPTLVLSLDSVMARKKFTCLSSAEVGENNNLRSPPSRHRFLLCIHKRNYHPCPI